MAYAQYFTTHTHTQSLRQRGVPTLQFHFRHTSCYCFCFRHFLSVSLSDCSLTKHNNATLKLRVCVRFCELYYAYAPLSFYLCVCRLYCMYARSIYNCQRAHATWLPLLLLLLLPFTCVFWNQLISADIWYHGAMQHQFPLEQCQLSAGKLKSHLMEIKSFCEFLNIYLICFIFIFYWN